MDEPENPDLLWTHGKIGGVGLVLFNSTLFLPLYLLILSESISNHLLEKSMSCFQFQI